ncbi:pre-mRNA-processing protein 40B-like isoform X1 [Rutidosis leptorrhynchoides]|uniref:pre-mRNA-processing protein 40B-like isoform X1 n=1 Tax=Rutidosis leptorrhynchoides TaxID=125765 RepID=UPI003A99BE40
MIERKKTFREFIEKRYKAFKKMLEESKEITSSTEWSKAVSTFKDDYRFKAVEQSEKLEEIFNNHVSELKKKLCQKELHEEKRNWKRKFEVAYATSFIMIQQCDAQQIETREARECQLSVRWR